MIRLFFSTKSWLRYTLSTIYLALIVLLSLLPTSDFPDIPLVSGEDKYIHICMYLGLGFLACWTLDFKYRKQIPSLILMLAGVTIWGVLMEILQRLMSNGRGMEFLDMVANFTGAVLGLIIYKILDRKRVGIALQD